MVSEEWLATTTSEKREIPTGNVWGTMIGIALGTKSEHPGTNTVAIESVIACDESASLMDVLFKV